jgi:hypothetical protein
VRISAEARVILDDEILLSPGSLSGTVHLRSASNHRRAIILFMGANLYATPSDSTGAFIVPALAQGIYTLRILTAENDYAPVETTMAVASGLHASLQCIELQKTFVPAVESLSVTYNPALVRAVLTWSALDTAKIRNYTVYCNRPGNLHPAAIIDKSIATCSFDIFASPIDTFRYEISVVGKDGVEGPSVAGKPMVKYNAIRFDTITAPVSLDYVPDMCFDRHGNMFVSLSEEIVKLDSNGALLRRCTLYPDTSDTIDHVTLEKMYVDAAGNIYGMAYKLQSPHAWWIMKFSNDLTNVRNFKIDSIQGMQPSIAVSAAGDVLLYAAPDNPQLSNGTHYRVYDSLFHLKKTGIIPGSFTIDRSLAYGDTTVCLICKDFSHIYQIVYFDPSFEEISTPVKLELNLNSQFEELSPLVPEGYAPYDGVRVVSRNLFALRYFESEEKPPLLLIFDDHLNAVARVPYGGNGFELDVYFNCRGNLHEISSYNSTAIFKCSTAKLLTPQGDTP